MNKNISKFSMGLLFLTMLLVTSVHSVNVEQCHEDCPSSLEVLKEKGILKPAEMKMHIWKNFLHRMPREVHYSKENHTSLRKRNNSEHSLNKLENGTSELAERKKKRTSKTTREKKETSERTLEHIAGNRTDFMGEKKKKTRKGVRRPKWTEERKKKCGFLMREQWRRRKAEGRTEALRRLSEKMKAQWKHFKKEGKAQRIIGNGTIMREYWKRLEKAGKKEELLAKQVENLRKFWTRAKALGLTETNKKISSSMIEYWNVSKQYPNISVRIEKQMKFLDKFRRQQWALGKDAFKNHSEFMKEYWRKEKAIGGKRLKQQRKVMIANNKKRKEKLKAEKFLERFKYADDVAIQAYVAKQREEYTNKPRKKFIPPTEASKRELTERTT
uniref:Uncharacterized protein n=1 Tax=Cacopsylla melanoneura TaxID=428564 RepID=A0A8D9ASH1_9HEMI